MFLENVISHIWLVLFLPLFLVAGLWTACFFIRRSIHIPSGKPSIAAAGSVKENSGRLLSVQAASTVLAATVGIGNIIGTSQAIAMGGPSAVFWMWVAGLFGMAVKYAEIRFGLWNSEGAAGYISAVLGNATGVFYSVAAVFSVLLVCNMAQMNATVSSFQALFETKRIESGMLIGLGFLLLLGLCLLRGTTAVGKVCSVLVPVMAIIFLWSSGLILYQYRSKISITFKQIIQEPFRPNAVFGGATGFAVKKSMLWGLRRGAFSNEAGLGTAANIHSMVRAEKPELHAFWGVAEVFVDTFLLCTMTAMTILCSGIKIPYGSLPGPELITAVYARVFGEKAAARLIAGLLAAFGFSTTLGCYVNGFSCAEKIGLREGQFQAVYMLCALLGILAPVGGIWRLADTVNVLMAVPNLLALIILTWKWKKIPNVT